MMTIQAKPRITQADFEAFVNLPENSEKILELISGEVVEVPSNPFVSVIAAKIIIMLGIYLLKHEIGHVSGEGGGYIIDGQVFAPDVAFSRKLPTNQGYEQTPPLLAVEVISDPHDNTEQSNLRRKLVHYMRAGVMVWVVDYVARTVDVHIPGEAVILVDETGTLDGGAVLPGFELPVKDIFPKPEQPGTEAKGD